MGRFFGPMAAMIGLTLLLPGVATAEGQKITESVGARDIAEILTGAGLAPTLLTDKATGAPVATGQADGMIFVVRALDCNGRPIKCQQLLLFANFDLGRDVTDEDFRIVNDFNESNLNGRAYVLEGKSQIGIDYYIDLTGGVTGDHIGARLGRWPGIIRDFRDEMARVNTGS